MPTVQHVVGALAQEDEEGDVMTNGFDEAKATMGHDLGTLYWALYQEVAELHLRWHEYCKLYHHTPERVDFLNKAAPGFFAS